MKPGRAVFRFEASPRIGAGHAIRCWALARALEDRGWECVFATQAASYQFIPQLADFVRFDPHALDHPSPSSAPWDWLVVDHYGSDIHHEACWRPWAKQILVIDDLADRSHDCDLLLDPTPGRLPSAYLPLVPPKAQLFLGPSYALLREEFVRLRPLALARRARRRGVKRVLVSMGGGGGSKPMECALEALAQVGFEGAVDIVGGFQSLGMADQALKLERLKGPCTLHTQPDMAALTYAADVALGAAGTSVWERCVLGLPQFVRSIADNQRYLLPFFPHDDFGAFWAVCQGPFQLPPLSVDVDGLGAVRMATRMMGYTDAQGIGPVWHQKMALADAQRVWEWQQFPSVRQFALRPQAPTYSEHQAWFAQKLAQPLCIFEKLFCGNSPCGALRLDPEGEGYRLSWYILPEFQHRGLGTLALQFAQSLVFGRPIWAFSLAPNKASHHALRKARFQPYWETPQGTEYAYLG